MGSSAITPGGVVQEPLVGPVGAVEDPVQHVEAVAGAQSRVEELHQGVELIAGEGRVNGEEGPVAGVIQFAGRVVGQVVEIGAGLEVDRRRC